MFMASPCQAQVAIHALMHIAIRQAKKNAALFILWIGGQNPFREPQLFLTFSVPKIRLVSLPNSLFGFQWIAF
jgi:hypothetical protein